MLSRHIYIFFLLLLSSSLLKAAIPDSLRQAYHSGADTAMARQLIERAKSVMYFDPELAENCTELALEKSKDWPQLHALSNLQRGVIAWVNSDFSEALSYYEKSMDLALELGDSMIIAKTHSNIGLAYTDLSQYDLALENYLKSLGYFERQQNKPLIATLRNNIANVYNRNSDDSQAETYYRQALQVFLELKDTGSVCMVNNNLGLLKKDQGHHAEATHFFETALDGYTALGFLYGQTKVMSNLGTVYMHLERTEEAESLHTAGLDIAKKLQNPHEIAISRFNLAEFYRQSGEYQKAITLTETSLEAGFGGADLLLEATHHEGLADLYERIGNFPVALDHYKQFKILNDSVFNAAKAKSLAEMRVRYESDLKTEQIKNLEQEKALDWQRKIGLAIALALLAIIGLLIVVRQRGTIRREKALKAKDREVHAAQKALAEAEIKSAEAEKLRLQEDLNYKTKEITNLAMNIVRHNELLEVLDRELKALRKGADEKKLKSLSLLVSQNLSLENERKEFQIFIQEAQQNFFQKLEEKYPKLSQKEKRLCAMIKLGLSSKEIAAVFNIATSSVEVARYRLRKKLGLSTNEGLKAFLTNF